MRNSSLKNTDFWDTRYLINLDVLRHQKIEHQIAELHVYIWQQAIFSQFWNSIEISSSAFTSVRIYLGTTLQSRFPRTELHTYITFAIVYYFVTLCLAIYILSLYLKEGKRCFILIRKTKYIILSICVYVCILIRSY